MSTRKQARDTIQPSADLDLNPETVKDLEPRKQAGGIRGGRSSSGSSIAGSVGGSIVT